MTTKFFCKCGKSFRKENYFKIHQNNCISINFEEKISPYIKNSLKEIEIISGVPKVVFVTWFGTLSNPSPLMSERRYLAFKSLVDNIEVPIILITEKNLKYFIKDEYPIHEGFQYLSGVHKSDYIRCYLLFHYGGAYHDIKFRDKSWKDCWNQDDWLNDDAIWIFGRRELHKGAIGYPPGKEEISNHYKKLISMNFVICKPYTPYLHDLVEQIHEKLDKHLEKLKQYPAIHPGGNPDCLRSTPPDSYPLRWLEILGELYHPLMLKYNKYIKFGIPDAINKKRYK